MATVDCGSYSSFTAPSFTPAAASPEIIVWNQLTTRVSVHQVTSPGQSPQQRMSLASGDWLDETSNTAGLWFVTDDDWINILPLNVDGACYHVMRTSDDLIVVE